MSISSGKFIQPHFRSTQSKKEIDYVHNNASAKTKEHLSMVVRKNVGIAGTISTYVDHPLEQVFDGCHRITSVSWKSFVCNKIKGILDSYDPF